MIRPFSEQTETSPSHKQLKAEPKNGYHLLCQIIKAQLEIPERVGCVISICDRCDVPSVQL